MKLLSSSRRTALAAAAVLAAAGVATAVSAIGDGSAAAGTPRSSPTATSTEPIVTPIAAALIRGPIDIDRRHRSNVVSVRIDFRAGDTTGWHSHPGPVLVQVDSGAVTLRHAAHGRCLSEVVRAGHGFFEAPGAIHVAENRGPAPAVVHATFILPPTAGPEVTAPIPAPCR
jgi:quercetin dioxygenase-like cupin family protein